MLMQDTTTATSQWVLQPLPPFVFQQPCTLVAQGIVYIGTYKNCIPGSLQHAHQGFPQAASLAVQVELICVFLFVNASGGQADGILQGDDALESGW